MLVSDYNYNLPDENIAKHPPKVRGTTRLLVLNRKTGDVADSRYADLADFLEPGDLVILNDTRVMRARVFAELPGGYKRELVVLEKHKADLNSVMYHGKLRAGDVLTVLTTRDGEQTEDTVTIREILGTGTATVSSSRPLADIVEDHGTVPLPPYLHRDADPDDIKRCQTVWA
jgi:S-adenosylmethionine:tRNA ribosyltransferase-isomerase